MLETRRTGQRCRVVININNFLRQMKQRQREGEKKSFVVARYNLLYSDNFGFFLFSVAPQKV